jgi:cell division protein ZapA
MSQIEFSISGQSYLLKGEDPEEHLIEVSELVQRKIENLRKKHPEISQTKATMLTALDLASQYIKSKKRSLENRNTLLSRVQTVLERVESELTQTHC